MPTLRPEDFAEKPGTLKLMSIECGEALMNDNTVFGGDGRKGEDNFRPGLIAERGKVMRPAKKEIREADFDEEGRQRELVAPVAGIKVSIKTMFADDDDKPVLDLPNWKALVAFQDSILETLQRNGVELEEIRFPRLRNHPKAMIVDEYNRNRDRLEESIGNETQDWDRAAKVAPESAMRLYGGQYTFQFLLPTDASQDQLDKLAKAIGEISRTVERFKQR